MCPLNWGTIRHPLTISGVFYDDNGNLLFKIIENEWEGNIENWDIEAVGSVITIRKQLSQTALKIQALPPDGILIEQANMLIHDVRFSVNKYQANLIPLNGSGVIVQGRQVVGKNNDASFMTGYSAGKCTVGGGGDFIISGAPTILPDVIKNRQPIGRNSKCPCDSGLKYKKCCSLGDDRPSKGPILTFAGIPLT